MLAVGDIQADGSFVLTTYVNGVATEGAVLGEHQVTVHLPSPHAGGIHACMGDGSIRFVDGGVSDEVWQQACDPRDGILVPADLF